MLGANRCSSQRSSRWRWRRGSRLLLTVVCLYLLLDLALLDVQLDEVGVLFDLIFGDAHSQQFFQQGLPRRIRGINCRVSCTGRVGMAMLRRGGYARRDDRLRLLLMVRVPVPKETA